MGRPHQGFLGESLVFVTDNVLKKYPPVASIPNLDVICNSAILLGAALRMEG